MRTVNVLSPRSRIALCLAIGSLLSPAAGIAANQLDSLLNSSLFGTPAKAGQAADTGNQAFEFRGVSTVNGQQLFSIYDTSTKHSLWLGLNDSSSEVVVKNYDADAGTISLEKSGQVLSLTVKSGPRIAQNIPPPMQPGMQQPGVPGMPGQQGQPNGMAKGPEAQRMQQIAEEIRRRRALRQQGPQPATGGPQMPMPMPTPGAPGGGAMPLPGATPSSGGPAMMPAPLPGASTGPVPIYPPKQ